MIVSSTQRSFFWATDNVKASLDVERGLYDAAQLLAVRHAGWAGLELSARAVSSIARSTSARCYPTRLSLTTCALGRFVLYSVGRAIPALTHRRRIGCAGGSR